MKPYKIAGALAALVLLAGCSGGLPSSTLKKISAEHELLQEARGRLEQSKAAVAADIAKHPELFSGTSQQAIWQSQLKQATEELEAAQATDRRLEDLWRNNRRKTQTRAEQLLSQEASERDAAFAAMESAKAQATKWVAFEQDLPGHLAGMEREREAIQSISLTQLADAVERAEHDWPAKKAALDERLNSLRTGEQSAEDLWTSSAPVRQNARTGSVAGPQLATLIDTDEQLSRKHTSLVADADALKKDCGQLYDSWDKVLTDLDRSDLGGDTLYRERIKTIRTHISDVEQNTTQTTSEEHWTNVTEPEFDSLRNDIGMAIAHKNAGLFDSEAERVPQPPGFAYIADESRGSNEYGYWDHRGGNAFWVWLPRYLILRELLWNHDYRPVVINEFRSYQTARSASRPFYGKTTPAAPPKYGTHGTFTESHYAASRYATTGGFSESRYASARASAPADQHSNGLFSHENDGSNHFGTGAKPSSGRRFGNGNAFRGGMGRRFGRR